MSRRWPLCPGLEQDIAQLKEEVARLTKLAHEHAKPAKIKKKPKGFAENALEGLHQHMEEKKRKPPL